MLNSAYVKAFKLKWMRDKKKRKKKKSEMKMRAKQAQPCVPTGSDNPICSAVAGAVNRVYFMALRALGRDVRSKVKDGRRRSLTLWVPEEVHYKLHHRHECRHTHKHAQDFPHISQVFFEWIKKKKKEKIVHIWTSCTPNCGFYPPSFDSKLQRRPKMHLINISVELCI